MWRPRGPRLPEGWSSSLLCWLKSLTGLVQTSTESRETVAVGQRFMTLKEIINKARGMLLGNSRKFPV